VTKATQEIRDHKAKLDQQVCKAHKDQLVLEDYQVSKVQQVHKDCVGLQDPQALKALKVFKV
jgi:urease accessory protein UreE